MVQWNKHRGYADVMTAINENGKQLPERIPFSGALPKHKNIKNMFTPPLADEKPHEMVIANTLKPGVRL